MEQTKYWMWSGRELSGRSHVLAAATAYNDSWEEQAFAEDSAGALGGCTWPPRSYSCTFCGREFKSAQALGGHMNVHRRDRARLKQSPNSHQSPCTQLGMQFPSQICSLVCNPNPNPCPNLVASPLSPSKASAPSTQENCYAQGLVSPSHSSSHAQEHKLCSIFPPDPTLSVTAFGILDLKLEGENLKLVEERCRMKRVDPYSEVSSSDLVRNQDQREVSGGDREEISVKRRRKESFLSLFIKPNMGERRIDASLPFFIKPRSCDRDQLQSDVLGLGPNPIEDLDLELRLGDRPKVK